MDVVYNILLNISFPQLLILNHKPYKLYQYDNLVAPTAGEVTLDINQAKEISDIEQFLFGKVLQLFE